MYPSTPHHRAAKNSHDDRNKKKGKEKEKKSTKKDSAPPPHLPHLLHPLAPHSSAHKRRSGETDESGPSSDKHKKKSSGKEELAKSDKVSPSFRWFQNLLKDVQGYERLFFCVYFFNRRFQKFAHPSRSRSQ